MSQVERARRFAQLAYAAAVGEIVREYDEKRHAVWSRSAASGGVKSLAMTDEAKLDGEQIAATIKAQLTTLLDGYELNGVPIDDELATTIASEVGRSLESSIALPCISYAEPTQRVALKKLIYRHRVSQNVGISPAWIRTEIDRRRFTKRPQASTITLYHIEGDTPRDNVDNSVSALIKSNEQLFANLRQKIESYLQEGYERTVILEKLTALKQAQDSKSFARRYADFISAASKHLLLVTPFTPALTEMLHKALS